MNAQELRIGNWVYNSHKEVTQISTLSKWKDIHDSSFFEPIPLTEEVLVNCGFSKGKYGEQEQWLSKENERHNPYTKFSIGLINSPIYGFLFQMDITTVALQSLHQLQNLYFILTGTELTYTPPNKVKEI